MINLLISIVIGVICGLLGAYGGAEGTSKNWRRLGIPILLTILALIVLRNHWVLTMGLLGIVLSLGYAIPPGNSSDLGYFFYNTFKEDLFLTDISTRMAIGSLIGLTLLSIPIIKGNWLLYIFACFIICMVNGLFGGDGIIKREGMFYLFGKDLLVEDIILYGVLGLCVSVLIL